MEEVHRLTVGVCIGQKTPSVESFEIEIFLETRVRKLCVIFISRYYCFAAVIVVYKS